MSETVYNQLHTVESLRHGEAPERPKVKPVPRNFIRSVRHRVSRHVRALIDLQLLTGARAGELVNLREIDIDRSRGDVWIYNPHKHKTVHHDKERSIYFGPRAQKILLLFRFPDFAGKWYVFLQIDKTGYATRLLTDMPMGHGFLVHLDNRTRLKGRLLGPDGSPAANATFDIVTSKPTARAAMANPIPDLTVTAKADDQGQYDTPWNPGNTKFVLLHRTERVTTSCRSHQDRALSCPAICRQA